MSQSFQLRVIHYPDPAKPGKEVTFTLVAGKEVTLGRYTLGDAVRPEAERSDWVVPEASDEFVMGRHVLVRQTPTGAAVTRLAGKVYFAPPEGVMADRAAFELVPGQQFQIGRHICLLQEPGQRLNTVRLQSLREAPYANPSRRVDTVCRLVGLLHRDPNYASARKELLQVLMDGCEQAHWGAVIRLRADPTPESVLADQIETRRSTVAPEPFLPSVSTLALCHVTRECVLKVWGELRPQELQTLRFRRDWAIALPVPRLEAEEEDVAIYLEGGVEPLDGVAGKIAAANAMLQDYQKLIETAGQILVAHRRMGDMQDRLGNARHFLPEPLRRRLKTHSLPSLTAEEMSVTVMFCDIRGSVELGSSGGNSLTEARARIESALEIMTSAVSQYGIVGDLQGDAMMGFWGWPDSPEKWELVEQGVKAAAQIAREFDEIHSVPGRESHLLRRTKCGIGLAHGRALVGVLGTSGFKKLDVFGPIANLASRLESLTKPLGVAIATDGTIAGAVTERLKTYPNLPTRVLGLGRYLPPGLGEPIEVFELFPDGYPDRISFDDRQWWDRTVEGIFNGVGNWSRCVDRLATLRRHLHFGQLATRLEALLQRFPDSPPVSWPGYLEIDKAGNILLPRQCELAVCRA